MICCHVPQAINIARASCLSWRWTPGCCHHPSPFSPPDVLWLLCPPALASAGVGLSRLLHPLNTSAMQPCKDWWMVTGIDQRKDPMVTGCMAGWLVGLACWLGGCSGLDARLSDLTRSALWNSSADSDSDIRASDLFRFVSARTMV